MPVETFIIHVHYTYRKSDLKGKVFSTLFLKPRETVRFPLTQLISTDDSETTAIFFFKLFILNVCLVIVILYGGSCSMFRNISVVLYPCLLMIQI